MKTKHLYAILIPLILFTFIFSLDFRAIADDTNMGFLDEVNGDMIRGWAWNRETPDEAIDVHIYIYRGNTNEALKVIPLRAEQYRYDLEETGYGNGKHGYSYRIDWASIPEADMYRIEAYGINGEDNPRLQGIHTYSSKYSSITPLGNFEATAYCACNYCTWGSGLTATGTVPRANHTISVDTSKIPMGTKLLINGIVYTAEDRGGGIKGNHVDIYFNTHQEALNYGRKKVQVFIVEES